MGWQLSVMERSVIITQHCSLICIYCYFQSSCPQVVSQLKQDNIKGCSPVRVNDIELQVCQVKCSTEKGGLSRIKEQRGVLLAAELENSMDGLMYA